MTMVDAQLVEKLEELIQSSSDDNFTSQHDSDLGGFIERLFADVGLAMPPKLYRSSGRSGTGGVIRFHTEGRWLLTTSREIGAEESVRRLREFITANEGSYSEVCVFWGMHPPTRLELADGVELGPVDALPQSDQRDFFLGTSLSDEERGSSEYVTTFPKPRAALVKRTTEKPVYFYVEGPRAERPRPEFTYEDKHFHEDLMHVLPVVTRSPVIRIAQWHTWYPDTPVVSLGGGMGWNQHRRAANELDKEPYDEKAVLEMVQGYFALNPVSRNRLRMPLRRFNAFLMTKSRSDRAIEAGVALESLLSQPGDPTESITHRLAVRAALLCESDLEARQDKVRRVKDLYAFRSFAAHGVDLDEWDREREPWGLKKASRKYRTHEAIRNVLADAPSLIADVVTAIIRLGGFPDYRTLDLNPEGPSGVELYSDDD